MRFLSLPEIVRKEEVGEGNYLTLKEKETNGEIASCCGRTWFCIEQEVNFLLTFTGAKSYFSSELHALGP